MHDSLLRKGDLLDVAHDIKPYWEFNTCFYEVSVPALNMFAGIYWLSISGEWKAIAVNKDRSQTQFACQSEADALRTVLRTPRLAYFYSLELVLDAAKVAWRIA